MSFLFFHWAFMLVPLARTNEFPPQELKEMKSVLVSAVILGLASAAYADSSTYSSDFSNADGNYWGAAGHTTFNGHGDLQLTSDYPNPGDSDSYFGTWATGGLENTTDITGFSASYKFSMNNNNGSWRSDGFSFLFGNLSNDMNGFGDYGHTGLSHWKGGEWGFNNFSRLNAGMSVGFGFYGNDAGVNARWASAEKAYNRMGEDWADSVVYYGYDWALNNNHQATAYIDWDTNGDLVVSIAWPSNAPVEYLRTNAFQGIDTEDFQFGFAGRVGGATWDVLIDDLNIEYSYSTPVPGLGGIAFLAGIGAVRRRRR